MKWFRKRPKGPGVHNPEVVDLVTATDDAVILIMVASGEWFDAGRPLLALQKKVDTYATLAVSGALVQQYPSANGKRIVIQLDYPDPPDSELTRAIERASLALADHNITLRLNVMPELRGA